MTKPLDLKCIKQRVEIVKIHDPKEYCHIYINDQLISGIEIQEPVYHCDSFSSFSSKGTKYTTFKIYVLMDFDPSPVLYLGDFKLVIDTNLTKNTFKKSSLDMFKFTIEHGFSQFYGEISIDISCDDGYLIETKKDDKQ